MRRQRLRAVEAELIADAGAAVAVRVAHGQWRPVGDRMREVVVQVREDLDAPATARLLRELADEIERR